MEDKKYENYQDFIIAFDSTPEEIIKKETYELLKLYNQTQQQLATYKQKEDKLKSAIAKLSKDEYIELFANEYVRSCLDDFLRILDEGGKECL